MAHVGIDVEIIGVSIRTILGTISTFSSPIVNSKLVKDKS